MLACRIRNAVAAVVVVVLACITGCSENKSKKSFIIFITTTQAGCNEYSLDMKKVLLLQLFKFLQKSDMDKMDRGIFPEHPVTASKQLHLWYVTQIDGDGLGGGNWERIHKVIYYKDIICYTTMYLYVDKCSDRAGMEV